MADLKGKRIGSDLDGVGRRRDPARAMAKQAGLGTPKGISICRAGGERATAALLRRKKKQVDARGTAVRHASTRDQQRRRHASSASSLTPRFRKFPSTDSSRWRTYLKTTGRTRSRLDRGHPWGRCVRDRQTPRRRYRANTGDGVPEDPRAREGSRPRAQGRFLITWTRGHKHCATKPVGTVSDWGRNVEANDRGLLDWWSRRGVVKTTVECQGPDQRTSC